MAGELADALIARIDTLIRSRLNAAISSRLAVSDYVAPDNLGIAAVQTKTDLIPVEGPPGAADYTPARAALLDKLDALISSRLAASDYTTPPTANAIWAAAARTLTSAPSAIASIQYGEIFFTLNSAATLTIAPVVTAKTVLLFLGTTNADTTFNLALARLFLVDSTTVRAGKWNDGGNGTHINFCVVEFT